MFNSASFQTLTGDSAFMRAQSYLDQARQQKTEQRFEVARVLHEPVLPPYPYSSAP